MLDGWLFVANKVISENTDGYILILLLLGIIYYKLFHRGFETILDPLCIALICDLFAMSVPLYVWWYDYDGNADLISLFFFEWLAFVLGLMIFRGRDNHYITSVQKQDEGLCKRLFYFYFFVFVFANIYIFLSSGIAILGEERTVISDNGIVNRLITCIRPVVYFLFAYLWINSSLNKLFKCITALLLMFFLIASGSKSAFVIFLYSIFFVNLFMKTNGGKTINFRKYECVLIPLAIIVAILIAGRGDAYGGIMTLLVRFLQFGDGISYILYGSMLDILRDSNDVYSSLVAPVASIFKVVPTDDASSPIGIQISQVMYGKNYQGPNARWIIYFTVLFNGYLSIIISFLFGGVISFVSRYLLRLIKINTIYAFIIYMLIYMRITECIVDVRDGTILLILSVGCNLILLFIFDRYIRRMHVN